MCGIAGIVLNSNRILPDLRERLGAMRDAMRHRGPDDSGIYVSHDGRAGLANCRLAIRDLSPAGHMPMGDADGATWITYNGEAYNADELRGELEHLGYRFRSGSDTEALLHGYRAWGPGVLGRARGMFAFAILVGLNVGTLERWNVGTLERWNVQRLFLARDRLGIKPLYYAHTSEAFVFASELKALLASGLLSREIDPAAVVAYLMLGSVPCPLTIYRDIRALEPGCSLSLDLQSPGAAPAIERYWELPGDIVPAGDAGGAAEQVRALLDDAVRSHLVSDVPLGAFLSGGLDSSAVVALMRAATSGPIRTCSMVFEEAGYSEAPFARAMAQAVGAEHYERVITASDVAGELYSILRSMDQPTIDGANTYFVAKTAREAGLTVALSGLGGDELFGGYANTFGAVPRLLRAVTLARSVPAGGQLAGAALSLLPLHRRWAKVADALGRRPSAASAYLACRGLFSPGEVRALVSPDTWHAAIERFDPVRHIAERAGVSQKAGSALEPMDFPMFNWVSRAELRTYTHDQLLRDTDAMSMAHSLEVRVPLLDHRLVEAVLRLPPSAKLGGDRSKALLLRAIGDMLPPLVRDRRAKQGFTFPFDAWLRGPLRELAEEPPHALLRPEAVARVRRAYAAGKLHWSRPWALAVLGAWAVVGQGVEG
jgi:asparagine synthase (glutamine-hydrolysing)